MFTYLILNLVFLLSLILFLPKTLSKPTRVFWLTLAVLLVLTAVFDPIIIGLGVVGYDDSLLLGIKILGAPIEDFFYAIYAACAVPLLWNRLGENHDVRKN
jgi:lycopene cyclase domain-containing protein